MRRVLFQSGYKVVGTLLVLLLVLVLNITVVAQSPSPTPSPSPIVPSPSATIPVPAPAPNVPRPALLSISLSVSPPATPQASPAANVTYADVEISIQVAGFNLVNKIGQANSPGEGHIIYYLAEPAIFPLFKAYTAQGTYFPSTSASFMRRNYNYTLGSYWVFGAQLVNNDDTPLDPPVFAEIVTNLPPPGGTATKPCITSFSLSTLAAATPPASPVPNATYMDVTLNPIITGFNIVSWIDDNLLPDAPGQGHYMYYRYVDPISGSPNWDAYIDDTYSYNSTYDNFTFTNSYAGYKAYSVQLVSNDNYPLSRPVYAIIRSNLKPEMGMPAQSTTATPVPTAIRTPPVSTTSPGGVP